RGVEDRHPMLELAASGRGIKHHILQRPPMLAAILSPHNADCPLERLAVDPQFTVKRKTGQTSHEPVGSVEVVALSGQELLSIPVGPHAIELLAEPPAGQILVVVPSMGQQKSRRGSLCGWR